MIAAPKARQHRSSGAALGRDERAAELHRLDRLAFLLDEAYRIPFTRWRIGIDGLAGLIPGLGDVVAGAVGLYPIVQAYRLGVPTSVIARMLANLGVDTTVGSIPLLGSIFDIAFKANRRNVELLRRHLEAEARRERR